MPPQPIAMGAIVRSQVKQQQSVSQRVCIHSLTGGLCADLLQQGLAVIRGPDVERDVCQPLRVELDGREVHNQIGYRLSALSLGTVDAIRQSENHPVRQPLQVSGGVEGHCPGAAPSLVAVPVAIGESALMSCWAGQPSHINLLR